MYGESYYNSTFKDATKGKLKKVILRERITKPYCLCEEHTRSEDKGDNGNA